MSTRSPKRYAAALRPVSSLRYCGPCSLNCLYAAASSRGVNVSRALGVTTTLIAAWGPRAPGIFFGGPPYLPGVDVPSKARHNRPIFPEEYDHARVACQV